MDGTKVTKQEVGRKLRKWGNGKELGLNLDKFVKETGRELSEKLVDSHYLPVLHNSFIPLGNFLAACEIPFGTL